MPPTTKTVRVEFSTEHDSYLCKYIATHCPGKEGRSGNKIYEQLIADQVQWPWSKHHTWQAWRQRYVKNADQFDACILKYQKKHDIKPAEKRKRAAEPLSIEGAKQSAKRVKRVQREEQEEEEQSPPKSERRAKAQRDDANSSVSMAEQPPPSKATSSRPNSVRKPAHPITPNGSPSRANADTKSATKEQTLNPKSQTRADTVEIPSTSPNRQAPPPESSLPRHVKRFKVRLGSPPDVFASDHEMDAAINGVPSSPTRPPSGNSAPTTTPPRAPPRVVDALHGQVMVDREGRVPCALSQEERDGSEETRDKEQWPPVRIKSKSTDGPTAEAGQRHPFSQLPTTIRSGASPAKRLVTAAPASNPFSGQIPKPFSKVFSAPRASTRSPFRPERPADVPQRSPSQGKAARHPALTRIRRQSMNGQGARREGHKRDVPSVDLVSLSRSSASARSHSHSSTDTSVPARPQRWSLPATPWVFGELDKVSAVWPHGTSTPRLMLTPSPARPANGAAPVPQPNKTSSGLLTPHPPDVPLTSSHGLASILGHMSANHGLALSVVEAVYKRVGNLREADEVLKGMREAAEGFGEQEIKRRVRGRRRSHGHRERGREVRRVVVTSEEDGSEYLPPETSRAAMWKRQSESASFDEEEEEAEGREVEEELRDLGEDEDEVAHHEFSQVEGQARDEHEGVQWEVPGNVIEVVENVQHAHELEKRLGKEHFRRNIAELWRSGMTH